MVHVIQPKLESPSLLSTKAVCHITTPVAPIVLSGLTVNPANNEVTAPSLTNLCSINFQSNLGESDLRPDLFGVVMNHAENQISHTLHNLTTGTSNITRQYSAQSFWFSSLPIILAIAYLFADAFHIFVGDLAHDIEDDTLFAVFNTFGNVT
ncbi:hypothetical protein EG68_00055 [Paragonimus skrjabini miyazakii]|uniref:Uncharacterized protein n=1 Tax=Paragonimus skrjabini miyazakii TaxID=59628 RepID=A0A8S9Z5B4_9TREM|nr:hypothetical protein EG68_00055 [Paragonimus skrjabini miyazakii]